MTDGTNARCFPYHSIQAATSLTGKTGFDRYPFIAIEPLFAPAESYSSIANGSQKELLSTSMSSDVRKGALRRVRFRTWSLKCWIDLFRG